jgi:hypothetical protein
MPQGSKRVWLVSLKHLLPTELLSFCRIAIVDIVVLLLVEVKGFPDSEPLPVFGSSMRKTRILPEMRKTAVNFANYSLQTRQGSANMAVMMRFDAIRSILFATIGGLLILRPSGA